MNKYIEAIKRMEYENVKEILENNPSWLNWAEKNGKNALHFLCQENVKEDQTKAEKSLFILKWLLKKGMDMNSIHQIPDACGFFPATPLWYAYAKGRNEKIFHRLLAKGANPEHCMHAIAWFDDVKAARLFNKYGADIDASSGGDSPFLAAFLWKRFRVAKWFLEHGANVNAKDSKGNAAIYFAVKRKYDRDKIKIILKHGADPDQENEEGISARKLARISRQKMILSLFEK